MCKLLEMQARQFWCLTSGSLQIAAAVGAQEAVAHCGGLSWILQAVGCPLRFQVDRQGCSVNEDALYFELTRYDDVTAPLKNQKRLRMTMLRAEGEIAQQTRVLFRYCCNTNPPERAHISYCL